MKELRFGKREKLLWSGCLLIVWCGVAWMLVRSQGNLTVEQLVSDRPENPLLSALLMVGLFCLKSVDFVMHSGVLYAADGILFPLPAAFLLNIAGIAIMVTPTYFLGRAAGPGLVQSLTEKYPKLREMGEQDESGQLLLTVILRATGIPLHAASLYMGARKFDFRTYMLGSVLGILPIMIPYTIMGESAGNVRSPVFVISILAEVAVSVSAVLLYAHLRRKKRRTDESVKDLTAGDRDTLS